MFNLEQSLSDWRKQMLAAGIRSPVPLEELEAHLRDDIEQQLKSGLSEKEAFELSRLRIGQPGTLRLEFRKTNAITGVLTMTRIIATITGLFGMVLGAGMILPALGNHARHPEVWTVRQLNPLILGLVLLGLGASAALYCIRTRKQSQGRIFVTLGLLLACAFYSIAALIGLAHARELTPAGWLIWTIAVAVSAAYFGICFRSNFQTAQLKTEN